MNALADLLAAGWTERLGWTLVHFLWQGAAVAALLWLALRLLGRQSPHVRYLVACLALLLMIAAPVVTFFLVKPAHPTVAQLNTASPTAMLTEPSASHPGMGSSGGKPAAQATTQPTITTPTVTFAGQSFYVCENASLPGYLRIGWRDGQDGEPVFCLFRYVDGVIAENARIAEGPGFVGDVTGDGTDELVIGSGLPAGSALRAKPVFVAAALTTSDGMTRVRGSSPHSYVFVYDITPGHKLGVLLKGSNMAAAAGYGSVPARDAAGKAISDWRDTDHTEHEQWGDLFGTGQPVWCKLVTLKHTIHSPTGQVTHETERLLRAYWQWDPTSMSFVETAADIKLPVTPQKDELRGLFKNAAPPASQPVGSVQPTVGYVGLSARLNTWFEPALPYAVCVWLAGVLACSIWHVAGWAKVQRLRRGAELLANAGPDAAWSAGAGRLAGALGLRRPVRLLKLAGDAAARLAGPVVVGVLKPVVLIPAAVVTGLAPAQVEAILAHELAHVRRHDYLVNLLQAVVETLLFYHPAVWWVSARIRAEREHCCDDLAVGAISSTGSLAVGVRGTGILPVRPTGVSPVVDRPVQGQDAHATNDAGRTGHERSRMAYAEALAALAELSAGANRSLSARLAPAARRGSPQAVGQGSPQANRLTPGAAGSLLSRVRRLLGVQPSPSSRWTAALAGALVLTALAAVVFYGCSKAEPRPIVNATDSALDVAKGSPATRPANLPVPPLVLTEADAERVVRVVVGQEIHIRLKDTAGLWKELHAGGAYTGEGEVVKLLDADYLPHKEAGKPRPGPGTIVRRYQAIAPGRTRLDMTWWTRGVEIEPVAGLVLDEKTREMSRGGSLGFAVTVEVVPAGAPASQPAASSRDEERKVLAELKAKEFATLKAQALDTSLDVSKRLYAVMRAAAVETQEAAEFLTFLWDNPLPIQGVETGLRIEKYRIAEMCACNPHCEALLRKALRDSSTDVRRAAMRALPGIIGQQAVPLLNERATKDEDPVTRNVATEVLQRLTDTARRESEAAIAAAAIAWARSKAAGPYVKGDVEYFVRHDALRPLESDRFRLYSEWELKAIDRHWAAYGLGTISIRNDRARVTVASYMQPPDKPVAFPYCGWRIDLGKFDGKWLAVHAVHGNLSPGPGGEWTLPGHEREYLSIAQLTALKPVIRGHSARISDVLPAGWHVATEDNVVTVSREQPIEWYGTISLPRHKDKADLKAKGFVSSSTYTIRLEFAQPMTAEQVVSLEKDNERIERQYYDAHPTAPGTGPGKPMAPPKELTDRLHRVPNVLAADCSVVLTPFISRDDPGEAFYDDAVGAECTAVEQRVREVLSPAAKSGVTSQPLATPAVGEISPQATPPAGNAGGARASVAALVTEAEALRKERSEQWARDEAVAYVLARHAADVKDWRMHAGPPPPDVAPLKLPLAYLVWHWRDVTTTQRLPEAGQSAQMYLRAIADSADERRIDVLLQVLGGGEWGGELLVKAMTPERIEPSIRELLAGSPKLRRDAPVPTLLHEFAKTLSPGVRKAGYDWIRANWPRGPSNGDGERYWETLFRLDLDRARGDVIPYYGQRDNHADRYDLYVLWALLAHAGPSEQVASAIRQWRKTPDEFLDPFRRRVLVCADTKGELEGYVTDIEAQLKSGQRPDEVPDLVRTLVDRIPRQSVKYLRQFANDRRLSGLMGEGVRMRIVGWLVEQQDEQAEKIVARWLAEEDQIAQGRLIHALARQGEFARGLLRKVRPDVKLPPLPAEENPATPPAVPTTLPAREGRISELLALLKRGDADGRIEAAKALGELRDPRVVPALLAALNDTRIVRVPGPWISYPDGTGSHEPFEYDGNAVPRAAAARALGRVADPAAVEPLIAAAHDKEGAVRIASAEALGLFGDRRAIAPLRKLLDYPDTRDAAAAATALGKIGGPEPIEALRHLLKSPHWVLRQAAITALALDGGNEAVDAIATAMKDERGDIRHHAIRTLGGLGTPRARAALQNALDAADPDTRAIITDALKHNAAQTPPATQPTGAWSDAVNGLRAKIHVGAYLAKRLGMEVGVQFENVSDEPLAVDFGELRTLAWKVIDADGKEVEPAGVRKAEPAPAWVSIAPRQQAGPTLGTSRQNLDGRLVIGFYEWKLQPGRYSIRCTLALQSDAVGRPAGQTAWKGKIELPPVEFEVIGEVSDEDLGKAARKVRAAHPAGGLAMWEALAELVRPGMTVRQMCVVLPPRETALKSRILGASGVYGWIADLSVLTYSLDDQYGVEARGIGGVGIMPDRTATQATGDLAGENMVLNRKPSIKLLTPAATQPAQWQLVAKNDLASVQVQKMLYDQGPESHFFIRVRLTNVSGRTIGVDLREYGKVIYPNQWGDLRKPQREDINERRQQFSPMTAAPKTRLIEDFKAGKLVRLEQGQSVDYYRDFNNAMGGRPVGAPYVFISLDGQVEMTDGIRATRITCETDYTGKALEGSVDTDVYLPPGVKWEKVPGEALVFSDGKVLGTPATQPAAPPHESASGKEVGGLALKLRTDKAVYQVGEKILLRFVLKNASPGEMKLYNQVAGGESWYCRPAFADAAGKDIPSDGGNLSTESTDRLLTVAAGEEVELSVDLGRWRLAGLGHPYTPVGKEPRTIVVTGTYFTPEGTKLQNGVWSGQVSSGPLTIRIVEPATPPATQGEAVEAAIAEAVRQCVGKDLAPAPTALDVQIAAEAETVAPSPGMVNGQPKSILIFPVRITNRSSQPIETTLAHEWHGGRWPPTNLYAGVVSRDGVKVEGEQPQISPVYRAGERGTAAGPLRLESGKRIRLELRMDWPGTTTMGRYLPVLSADKPGKYRVKFYLVFHAQAKWQFVASPPVDLTVKAAGGAAGVPPAKDDKIADAGRFALEGRVTFAEDGRPAAGTFVRLDSYDPDAGTTFSATTKVDDRGAYALGSPFSGIEQVTIDWWFAEGVPTSLNAGRNVVDFVLRPKEGNMRAIAVAPPPTPAATQPANAEVLQEVRRQIALLGDADPLKRSRAAMALGNIGPSAAEAVGQLVKLLHDKYEHETIFTSSLPPVPAQAAAEALARLGEGGEKALAAAAKDKDARVRARAVFAFGQAGGMAHVDILIEAMGDPDERVRKSAADAVSLLATKANWAEEKAVRELGTAASREERTKRLRGAMAPLAPTVPKLVAALTDKEGSVRAAATGALGNLAFFDHPQAGPGLARLALNDRLPFVRQACMPALMAYMYRQPEVVGLLIAGLEQEVVAVRVNAQAALEGMSSNKTIGQDAGAWRQWWKTEHARWSAATQPATQPAADPAADERGWSPTRDGLRMRLVGPDAPVAINEAFELRMLIQNVSDKPISIRQPFFMSVIRDPAEHPGGKHEAQWASSVITARWPHREKQGWQWHSNDMQAMEAWSVLQPRAIHTVIIKVGAPGRAAEAMRSEGPQAQRETLSFLYHGLPGKYPLTATYAVPAGTPNIWTGTLAAPPVEVELVSSAAPSAGTGPSTQPADPFLTLVRQAIGMKPQNTGLLGGQRATGLDFAQILAATGQEKDLKAFPKATQNEILVSPKVSTDCQAAIKGLTDGAKVWALAALLDHESVFVKTLAARELERLAELRTVPALLAAAKANNYVVGGSRSAGWHLGYRETLKAALEKITGLKLTPKGLKVTEYPQPRQPRVITSEEHPEYFRGEMDFAKVEAWLTEKYLPKAETHPATEPATQPTTQAARTSLDATSLKVGLYDDDKAKPGLYAIGPYARTRFPPFNALYDRAASGGIAPGHQELIGRMEGAYSSSDEFEVVKYVLLDTEKGGGRISAEIRCVRGQPQKAADGSYIWKRGYVWAPLPTDLAPGTYHVTVQLVEYLRENGKLVVAPKTAIRAFEHLTCTFEVPPPAAAATQPTTRAPAKPVGENELADLSRPAAKVIQKLSSRGNEKEKPQAAAEAIALAKQLRELYQRGRSQAPNADTQPAEGKPLAQRCLGLATDLLTAVYQAVPKEPIAAEAVFFLSVLAEDAQQWEACIRWCNVLLKDYPQAEIPGIVGKGHQFNTYRRLGDAQAELGQSRAAAEAFLRSLLGAEQPRYHISGWARLLQHDPEMGISARMGKAMPQLQAELARKTEASDLRVRLAFVPPAVTPGMMVEPKDRLQDDVLVTVEFPDPRRARIVTLRDFRVFVYAITAGRTDPNQPAMHGIDIVYGSDTLTVESGKSVSRQFTLPKAWSTTGRPVALLAELTAVEPPHEGNYPRPPEWTRMYWTAPIVLDREMPSPPPTTAPAPLKEPNRKAGAGDDAPEASPATRPGA